MEKSIKADNKILVCEFLRNILEIYERFNSVVSDVSYQNFLTQYEEFAYDDFERVSLEYYRYRILQRFEYENPELSIKEFPRFQKATNSIEESLLKTKIDITRAAYYQDEGDNLPLAKKIITEIINKSGKNLNYLEQERMVAAKIIYAAILFKESEYKLAESILDDINIGNEGYLYELLDTYVDSVSYTHLTLPTTPYV